MKRFITTGSLCLGLVLLLGGSGTAAGKYSVRKARVSEAMKKVRRVRVSDAMKEVRRARRERITDAVKSMRKPRRRASAEKNLKIEVAVRYKGLSSSAAFVVADAAQANYVNGGDKHFKVKTDAGEGVEYKKHGFIVNVLPVVDPNDSSRVSMQVQLELSGPVGDDVAKDILTWQYQAEVILTKGKKTVIVESPVHAEISISDYQPE